MLEENEIKKSVHLQDFPVINNFIENSELVKNMDTVRAICSTALFIRDKFNLRVRLPLSNLKIIADKNEFLEDFKDIIIDEVNVKNIEFLNNIEETTETKLQLNFQLIGQKYGAKIPEMMKAVNNSSWKVNKKNKIEVAGIELEEDEYQIKFIPKNKADNIVIVEGYNVLIELDIVTNSDLELEGLSRDLVRIIQQKRKEARLDISDRINLVIKTNFNLLKDAIEKNMKYIKEQTLAFSIEVVAEELKSDFSFCEELNGSSIFIGFSKI